MSEEEEISKEHVGKYVCYQQADGGACWGKVKNQGFVNTLNGEREVLILTDRYVRYERGHNMQSYRRFYPDAVNDPKLFQPVISDDGEMRDPKKGELFFEVRKVAGDTTLRLESINEETDLMELDDLLEAVGEKVLFEALMAGRTIGECLEDAKDKEVVSSKDKKVKAVSFGDDETHRSDSFATDGGSGALGITAIEIGLRHMIRTKSDFDQKAKECLAEKFGIKV